MSATSPITKSSRRICQGGGGQCGNIEETADRDDHNCPESRRRQILEERRQEEQCESDSDGGHGPTELCSCTGVEGPMAKNSSGPETPERARRPDSPCLSRRALDWGLPHSQVGLPWPWQRRSIRHSTPAQSPTS